MRVLDAVWPRLEYGPDHARAEQAALDADLAEIRGTAWTGPDAALSEAHRMADREKDRRGTADGRASNYLLVIAALIPLLASLESTVWDQKFGTAPRWLSLLILGIAVAYVLGAGFWAFRTLTVGQSHTVSVVELKRLLSSRDHENLLINEILANTRRNTDIINRKVSGIVMAHLFLRKGIFAFGALILVQVAWYWTVTINPWSPAWLTAYNSTPEKPSAGGPSTKGEPLPGSAALPPAVQEARPGPPCDPEERALARATKEMNGAFADRGFRGTAAYWGGLRTDRRRIARILGRNWDGLRQVYATAYKARCTEGG